MKHLKEIFLILKKIPKKRNKKLFNICISFLYYTPLLNSNNKTSDKKLIGTTIMVIGAVIIILG